MRHQRRFSLYTCIGYVGDFLRVELLPTLVVKVLEQWDDMLWCDEIDESIANVALILEVDGQVKKVITSLDNLINRRKQHLLCVLVWNVLDHQSGAFVQSSIHFLDI